MIGALLLAAGAATLPAAAPATSAPLAAREIARMPAPDARQGVVADASHFYAISNAAISKHERDGGKLVARWEGDPESFRHMNSCIMVLREIICAASNYPDVPMASSIEWFDADTMQHTRSRSLGPGRGSLTWLDWHDGSWWACFANYDGRGGEAGRDHRLTTLVRYSADFAEQGAWLFPNAVLQRFAPYSSSGGVWGADGLLYVTGHDLPETYALRLPAAGSRLELVATISISTPGQAIARDPLDDRNIWSIDRANRQAVLNQLPEIQAKP